MIGFTLNYLNFLNFSLNQKILNSTSILINIIAYIFLQVRIKFLGIGQIFCHRKIISKQKSYALNVYNEYQILLHYIIALFVPI